MTCHSLAFQAQDFALSLASFPLRWVITQHWVYAANPSNHGTGELSSRHEKYLWETALKWSPNDAAAIYGLAAFYLNHQQFAQAESYLNRFLQLSPHNSTAWGLLAAIHLRDRKLDQAESSLLKALESEPDNSDYRNGVEQLRKIRQTDDPITP